MGYLCFTLFYLYNIQRSVDQKGYFNGLYHKMSPINYTNDMLVFG